MRNIFPKNDRFKFSRIDFPEIPLTQDWIMMTLTNLGEIFQGNRLNDLEFVFWKSFPGFANADNLHKSGWMREIHYGKETSETLSLIKGPLQRKIFR